MKVKIKQLSATSIVPTYGTDGAGCFDLYADTVSIYSFCGIVKTQTIHTGLSFEVPAGYIMFVGSRSGHGFKYDVRLANGLGFIDSDYRGEVMVKLRCDGVGMPIFKAGDRVAQAIIMPYDKVTFEVVDELSSTERGTGGFGSTG